MVYVNKSVFSIKINFSINYYIGRDYYRPKFSNEEVYRNTRTCSYKDLLVSELKRNIISPLLLKTGTSKDNVLFVIY